MMNKYDFKPKSKTRELLGQKLIAISAFTAIIVILLIFIFIFKEALPIFTSANVQKEASLSKLFLKQQYNPGSAPRWSWQPNSNLPKYSLFPLFLGTLKAAIIAMLFAVPLGVG